MGWFFLYFGFDLDLLIDQIWSLLHSSKDMDKSWLEQNLSKVFQTQLHCTKILFLRVVVKQSTITSLSIIVSNYDLINWFVIWHMIKLTSEERCRYVCFNFRYAVEQKHWPFHGKVGTTEFMRQALHSSMADHHLKFIKKKNPSLLTSYLITLKSTKRNLEKVKVK